MNNFQFQRTAKNTRRKALVFTIVLHALLFGGITFGTEMGNKITDTVKEFFQDEQPTAKKKEPLAKNKK